MKKTRFFPLILIICLVFSLWAPSASALDDPALDAQAVVLVDMKTGEIIYSKNMNDQRSPASLTKIMTVLLAVEAVESGQCNLDDVITAKDDCRSGLGEDSSTSGIVPGEQLTYEQLLYCAMVQSANEACNVLASHISGSIGSFVETMNQRAVELGCTNTHFNDPNGLSNNDHYTTAYELYLITKEALEHPLFVTICNTKNYEVPATNMNEPRTMANSNALITADSIYGSGYVYEGASGVKTGYTRAAGYCLISTAERGDIQAMAVVLGCDGPLNANIEEVKSFPNSIRLYDWLFTHFSYRNVIKTDEPVQKVSIQLAGDGVETTLYPQADLTLLLPDDVTVDDIVKSVSIYQEKLVAPIAKGDELGVMSIRIGDTEYGTVKLVSRSDVGISKLEVLKQKLSGILSLSWLLPLAIILLVLILGYALLKARYRHLRRKHLEERRRAEAHRQATRERIYAEQRERARLERQEMENYTRIDASDRYSDPADVSGYFNDDDENR